MNLTKSFNAHYERLREAEIYTAWQESRAEEARCDYMIETAEEHIARLQKVYAWSASPNPSATLSWLEGVNYTVILAFSRNFSIFVCKIYR